MTSSADCPEPQFAREERIHGFVVQRVEQINDIRITAYEILHEKTGAKIIHLHCADKENLYAIGFRTPPKDSTGAPHILEHSVLAGSNRYPLKDAFNELIKGTMQTFLNAFTYPDKTIYPVASQERVDFYNLARVYTDLVLRPRLLKQTFAQEGHHFELTGDQANPDLNISGIVYNEMKGAYSAPEALLFKSIQEKLYGGSDYAHDSGGDPEAIPSLSYEQFSNFHRLYYSPSNARFFIYGNIPTKDHLLFLEEMLEGFDQVDFDSSIKGQDRWSSPASISGVYPVGKDEPLERRTFVNMAWMMTENTDHETVTLLEIISAMLVGSAAGPLRKALIESGLGQDLSPVTGLERDLKQICFAVGLRGSEKDRASRIERLIFDTLADIVKTGFDKELIDGTLHQVEFHGKEIVRGAYPYGIVLMGRVFHTWLYDGDPFVGLNFSKIISDIRGKLTADPQLFQQVVQRWFLDNPHRILAVMEPSRTYQDERSEAFRKKMADRKASLPPSDIEQIRKEAAALKIFQSEPDSAEALASLPKLPVSAISRSIDTVPTSTTSLQGIPVMQHELFTNGISYLDLAFDISKIPAEVLSYLPILGKLTVSMGAAGLAYDAMSKRIALKTGGVSCALECGLMTDGAGHWEKMIFRVKALHRNVQDAVQILSDLLFAGDLFDERRLSDLILEKKNSLQASVVPSGHVFARRTAGAGLSIPAWLDELWYGRTQLRFIGNIADRIDEERKKLIDVIMELKRKMFSTQNLVLNMTADEEGLTLLSKHLPLILGNLSAEKHPETVKPPALQPVHAGISVPAQVSYVAQVWPAPTYAQPESASLLLASRLLSNDYLYKRIRVQGGAYGGSSVYSPLSGLLAFVSYRDPHIVETLKIYREAVDAIMKRSVSVQDLEKAIIGAVAALDRPMDPAGKGYIAMIREISGLTDEIRLQFRTRILDMQAEKLREDVSRYFPSVENNGVIAVYSSQQNLEQANRVLEKKLPTANLI